MAAQGNFRHPERTEDEARKKLVNLMKQINGDEAEMPDWLLRKHERYIATHLTPAIHA